MDRLDSAISRSDLHHARQLVEVTGEEADVLVSCASASIRVDAFEDALAILRAALLIDPEHARAWTMSGMALDRLGRTDQARRAYSAALSCDDGDPIAAVALAKLHFRAGRPDEARALLEWVMARFPDVKHAQCTARALLGEIEAKKSA